MSKVGFWYDATAKKWDLADEAIHTKQFDFLQLAGLIQALLKEHGKMLGLHIYAVPKLPRGSTFKAYQRCLLSMTSRGVFATIDAAFQQAGITNVKKVIPTPCRLTTLVGRV